MPSNVPASLPERIVTFVEMSSEIASRAAAADHSRRDFEKQAEATIPGLVDVLATITVPDHRGQAVPLIEPGEKAACAQALRDPAQALNILVKVAGYYRASQVDVLGRAAPDREKRAQGPGPYAGRRTSQEPESFEVFKRAILG